MFKVEYFVSFMACFKEGEWNTIYVAGSTVWWQSSKNLILQPQPIIIYESQFSLLLRSVHFYCQALRK